TNKNLLRFDKSLYFCDVFQPENAKTYQYEDVSSCISRSKAHAKAGKVFPFCNRATDLILDVMCVNGLVSNCAAGNRNERDKHLGIGDHQQTYRCSSG
ncbi:MAG: hypothetical protein ACKO6L_08865, partial [Flavobacteriales bacterium]